MNLLLVVIDSLRKSSLDRRSDGSSRAPFLDQLGKESMSFSRAYASECWTLPAHLSMFTGLLPSQHGAHFQTMAYRRQEPTIAEILAAAGYATEVITRNSVFDGSLPGVTRGFAARTSPLAELRPGLGSLFSALLALAKPRVRRLIRDSGFFHAIQKDSGSFLSTLARMGIPADDLALGVTLERMEQHRRARRPYFLFVNLYDVHAPYSPSPGSPLRRCDSLASIAENLALPWLLPKISSHAYLRPDFRLPERHRHMLLERYHQAIELVDGKLARFYAEASSAGLLDDTLLIVTSDHGEGFGEHGLYLHDASVYETHLHVPLWVRHPALAPARVDDVVSTRDLFGLMQAAVQRAGVSGTILDPAFRRQHPVALAEHFHYPHTDGLLRQFRQNLAAAIFEQRKIVRRGDHLEVYDLVRDPGETCPERHSLSDVAALSRSRGLSPVDSERLAAHLARPVATRWAA